MMVNDEIENDIFVTFGLEEMLAYLVTVREHVAMIPDGGHHKTVAIGTINSLMDQLTTIDDAPQPH